MARHSWRKGPEEPVYDPQTNICVGIERTDKCRNCSWYRHFISSHGSMKLPLTPNSYSSSLKKVLTEILLTAPPYCLDEKALNEID